jgi:hypothetical protein
MGSMCDQMFITIVGFKIVIWSMLGTDNNTTPLVLNVLLTSPTMYPDLKACSRGIMGAEKTVGRTADVKSANLKMVEICMV